MAVSSLHVRAAALRPFARALAAFAAVPLAKMLLLTMRHLAEAALSPWLALALLLAATGFALRWAVVTGRGRPERLMRAAGMALWAVFSYLFASFVLGCPIFRTCFDPSLTWP